MILMAIAANLATSFRPGPAASARRGRLPLARFSGPDGRLDLGGGAEPDDDSAGEADYWDSKIKEVLEAVRSGVSESEFRELQRAAREESFERFREDMKTLSKTLQSEYKRDAERRKIAMDKRIEEIGQRTAEEYDALLRELRKNSTASKADWQQRYASPLQASAADEALSRADAIVERKRRAIEGQEAEIALGGEGDPALSSCVIFTATDSRKDAVAEAVAQRLALSGVECEVHSASGKTEADISALLSASQAAIFLAAGDDGALAESTVSAAAKALGGGDRPARMLLLSAVGSTRSGEFPFSLKGVFGGGLKKFDALEQSFMRSAAQYGVSHTVLRVGDLKGDAPPSSEWDGTVTSGILLRPGDVGDGATPPDVASEGMYQALCGTWPTAANATLTLLADRGAKPPATAKDRLVGAASGRSDWQDEMLRVAGPELLRLRVEGVDALQAVNFVRLWAEQFVEEGRGGLTTPVELRDVRRSNGVRVEFQGRKGTGFDDKDGKKKARKTAQGGVEVLVENAGEDAVRMRMVRVNYDDGVPVKVMSEELLVSKLRKAAAELGAAEC